MRFSSMQKHSIMWDCRNMTRKTVKRSISLRGDVYETAEKMADKLFGGNFSAYLTYLICADKYGISQITSLEEDESLDRNRLINDISNYEKSDENEDYIDSILKL